MADDKKISELTPGVPSDNDEFAVARDDTNLKLPWTAIKAEFDASGSADAVQADLNQHKANQGIHYTDAPADGNQYARQNRAWVLSTGAGVSDHGALTGLADDDHLQYHTDARGDARYDALGDAQAVQDNLDQHIGAIGTGVHGVFTQDNDGFAPGPTAADVSNAYVLGASGAWVPQTGGVGGGDILSDTPPPGPTSGQGWVNTTTMRRYVWYDDGTSQQWVQVDPSVAGGGGGGSGDVVGPPSATAGNFAVYADASGKLLADSLVAATDFAPIAHVGAGGNGVHLPFAQDNDGFVPGPTAQEVTDVGYLDATGAWTDPAAGIIPGHIIGNDGSIVGPAPGLNFTGAGVDAVFDGVDTINVTIPGSPPGSGYTTIQDNGSPLPQQVVLNFAGGLLAVDNAGASSSDVSIVAGTGIAVSASGVAVDGTVLVQIPGATQNNYASFDASGGIQDSGQNVSSFDPFGAATDAVAAHEAAADPHGSVYFTQAELDAAYAPLSHVGSSGILEHNVFSTSFAGFAPSPTAQQAADRDILAADGTWVVNVAGAGTLNNVTDGTTSSAGRANLQFSGATITDVPGTDTSLVTITATGSGDVSSDANAANSVGQLSGFADNTGKLITNSDTTEPTTPQSRIQGQWVDTPVAPVGGLTLQYTWSTSTAGGAPPDGEVRVDNADYSLATLLRISGLTRNAFDVSLILAEFRVGDFISVKDERNSNGAGWTITSVANNTTWLEFGISFIPGTDTGQIGNGRDVLTLFAANPNSRIPEGGADNDVLTKVSSADYDMAWEAPAGGGNVSAVPTPTDNQVAVWTGGTTVEGTDNFTYDDETAMSVVGAVTLDTLRNTLDEPYTQVYASEDGSLFPVQVPAPGWRAFTEDTSGSQFASSGGATPVWTEITTLVVTTNGAATPPEQVDVFISLFMSNVTSISGDVEVGFGRGVGNAPTAGNFQQRFVGKGASGRLDTITIQTDETIAVSDVISVWFRCAPGTDPGFALTCEGSIDFPQAATVSKPAGQGTSGSGVQVQDEAGTPFTAETLQYLGAGVTAVQNGTVAEITIPGGGTGGGLTLNTSGNPAAGNIIAQVGNLYYLDLSGMPSDRLFVLPDTAAVDDEVGFFIATGSDPFFLRAATAAAGSLINGVDESAGSATLFASIQNERMTFRCVNAGGAGDTDWIVESDDRIEHDFLEESGVTWVASDEVQTEPGIARVGGKLLSWSAPINSGPISTATPGRSANGVWNWYLYDNAGTPAVEYVQDTPVWDQDHKYWAKAGPDFSRRWVGYHWVYTDTGSTQRSIANFISNRRGGQENILEIVWPTPNISGVNQGGSFVVGDSARVLQGGTAVNSTAVSLANCIAIPCLEYWAAAKISISAIGNDAILGLSPVNTDNYINPGTLEMGSFMPFTVRIASARAGGNTFFGRSWIPLSEAQTTYYAMDQIVGSDSTATLGCHGARFKR